MSSWCTEHEWERGGRQCIYVVAGKGQNKLWRGMEKVVDEKFFLTHEDALKSWKKMSDDIRDSFAVFEVICIPETMPHYCMEKKPDGTEETLAANQ